MPLLPSFALMASYSTSGDPLPPSATVVFTVTPSTTTSGTSLTLSWTTTSVSSIRFIANNGVDPIFNSGLITSSLSSGSYTYPSGFSITTNILMLAEVSGGGLVTATDTVIIT